LAISGFSFPNLVFLNIVQPRKKTIHYLTKTGDLEVEIPDVQFMKKLLAVIEDNIPNQGFSVEFYFKTLITHSIAISLMCERKNFSAAVI
jgi:hypothetical protein